MPKELLTYKKLLEIKSTFDRRHSEGKFYKLVMSQEALELHQANPEVLSELGIKVELE